MPCAETLIPTYEYRAIRLVENFVPESDRSGPETRTNVKSCVENFPTTSTTVKLGSITKFYNEFYGTMKICSL